MQTCSPNNNYPSFLHQGDTSVNERNLTPEPIPIVPAQSGPPAPPAADPENGIKQNPANHDDRVLRVLGELKSQNEEQLSFQRSNHELVVDLSNRVRQIADEASSRERRAMLLELIMLYDSLEHKSPMKPPRGNGGLCCWSLSCCTTAWNRRWDGSAIPTTRSPRRRLWIAWRPCGANYWRS